MRTRSTKRFQSDRTGWGSDRSFGLKPVAFIRYCYCLQTLLKEQIAAFVKIRKAERRFEDLCLACL